MAASPFSYQKFVSFALEEAQRSMDLIPLPLQQCNCKKAVDGKTELRMLSFRTPKIRLLRSLTIDGGESMQVLDFGIFPEPEFDLPIFCANFFTASGMNIVVLDLNPLHDVINESVYREKYYSSLMPLGQKYAELLPWGEKITSESVRFFSPIVVWSKFTSSQCKHDVLYAAFMDYFKAWLELMDKASAENDASMITYNREAQHKYLTWRAEKDPGFPLLSRLVGESHAKDIVRKFLFNGVDALGSKSFLDYFPEYQQEDGTINKKRSVIGKSFQTRPWNAKGEFIGNDLR
ncbi:phytochromobilin:ferredoxin oxidoreductase, chloroplastic isoform X1 [Cinnamomum micranthum f. kanehirae]|uniref:Phytochromobilin:ferredoxin oxidoreductase, chloroplastic isoform X1 n=1 Tax=Cinnamomum micranthum f. kanehirae TaxID=337451 RepID=A0A443NMW8_9MAGN|nr:phytochromobilin:ferredoxin oxidoreductase, chloroplastic isoform X1 [Cinnamomum micranthum f. kanehirae]